MKKMIAEFIGTFTLVLLGCGTAVIAGAEVGYLGISFAFGLALIAMAYGIGPISGCQINPAVSLGAFFAGRMSVQDLIKDIISQFLGGIAAIGVLTIIVGGTNGGNLGQNFYKTAQVAAGYELVPAMVFEFVATLLFVIVILGATQRKSPTQIAGLAIGLTLVVIHILGIPITGVSVNPARSFGPALFVGGNALAQVWMFLLIPSLAGIVAGLLFKFKILEKHEE